MKKPGRDLTAFCVHQGVPVCVRLIDVCIFEMNAQLVLGKGQHQIIMFCAGGWIEPSPSHNMITDWMEMPGGC